MVADDLAAITNPLVTPQQLEAQDIPRELTHTLHYQSARLTQSAGILLKLPQEIIGPAIVLLQRFYTSEGSYKVNSAQDFSAAALYLTAKLSFQPSTTRSLLNVYAYLTSPSAHLPALHAQPSTKTYTLPSGQYLSAKNTLFQNESTLLRAIGFNTHVVLPHTLALTYLQTLSLLPALPTSTSTALAKRTLAHLNSALLSPQLLYLTHQPSALAVAAIYLAARETGVKLPERQWWRVWDVEREELGFLVVSFGSLEGFAREEDERWTKRGRRVPWTVDEVREEVERSEGG